MRISGEMLSAQIKRVHDGKLKCQTNSNISKQESLSRFPTRLAGKEMSAKLDKQTVFMETIDTNHATWVEAGGKW
jgi:hypothetical protein